MESQGQLFNNPNTDRARAKNPMPPPDKDGLFNYAGVCALAHRRDCTVRKLSDLAAEVVGAERVHVPEKDRTITLTAIAPGLWDPVAIIAACSQARGLEAYDVDRATAKPKNDGGLDEIKIARICAADSLRPYLTKESRYLQADGNPNNIMMPPNGEMQRLNREGYGVVDVPGMQRAGAGDPTWAFNQVLWSASNCHHGNGARSNSYAWRKAVRTLQDVGLLDVTPGPRGGLVRAVCRWTPLAYLPPVVRTAGPLDDADEHALACLSEGFPV